MKKIFSIIIGSLVIAGFPSQSLAKVNIFACEPEWKALAEEIGMDKVEVISAVSAYQDPHFIRAKPSLIAKMRSSDLVFCSGADLEVGWLPVLLQKSGSYSVQKGQIGYLMASDFVKRLDVPVNLDRAEGHIHAKGNPHIHLNPYNLIKAAKELSSRLTKLDPKNAEIYKVNFSRFESDWNKYAKKWELKAAPLKNTSVIVQHGSFSYFNDWLGIKQVADLEPKSGVPPTVSHLKSLLEVVSEKNPNAIILKPFDNKKGAKWLSDKTDIPVLVLPYTVGGNDRVKDLKSLFDDTIDKFLETN